ncbi:hypothetical protein BN1232_02754 [Mycobacterium lentiflavum]|uniref:Uncharacterized protein n=1 Tax=Mycobacterium lentiflavum TaxID=141349 RepID=A0A0E4CNA3_MYCLN|nr:hypothetical protein [Mycobacterium lentiflavum]CQD13702.1 hypothetical protein BN1232_02754 [Mycobacterium lentiflavum]
MFGIGRHQGSGPGDSVATAAKITGLFALCAAIITAIPPSINLLSSDKQPPLPTNTAPTTTTLPKVPDSGLTFGPLKNGKLTVSGSAQKDVVGMYVMIGPKPPGGYDTGCGVVTDGRWQVEVPTDPSWPKYPLMTVPAYGSCASAGSATGLNFTVRGTGTTTPTPPPGQVLDCTKENGPSCLTGPGFGPPTVYQPNQ